jgi:hypothetical protein
VSVDWREVARATLDEMAVPEIWRSEGGDYIHCRHDRKQLRLRTLKGGRTSLFFQCLVCGQAVGAAQAKTLPPLGSAPTWDVVLEKRFTGVRDRFHEACRANHEAAVAAEQAAWEELYARHVNPGNPAWQRLRRKVLGRCDGVCEGCMERPAVHLHHLTYAHLGNELLFELRAVCLDCHRILHPERFGAGPPPRGGEATRG